MSRRIVLALLLILSSAGILVAAPAELTRMKLHRITVIQGYSCAKDYTFFYTNGKLERCTTSQEAQYGEALIPRGSLIYLKPDGSLWGVGLVHSMLIHDVQCDGGGFLGPSEGSSTGFFPSGKLRVCYLAKNQVVQGVPCAHQGILASLKGPDSGVYFHEDGRLRSCLLAEDFGNQKKHTIWKPGVSKQ
jgi:hypothetical protein